MKGLTTYVKAQWDRVGAWGLIAVGFVALFLGWLGISGTTILAAQMPYLVSGGMVGLALIGVGGMLWLSADLKDEWRKLDAIHDDVRSERAEPVAVRVAQPAPVGEATVLDLSSDGVRQAVRR
jgi:hypothetical protein